MFTRALLKKYAWEASKVLDIKFKGRGEKKLQSIQLNRLDSFSFPVNPDSHNQMYVLHDNTGLDFIYVTELIQKDTGIPERQEMIPSCFKHAKKHMVKLIFEARKKHMVKLAELRV